MRHGTALLLLSVIACGGGGEGTAQSLVLATTTSVANSGLLDRLVDEYRNLHGVQVRTHLVGSGLALRMLEKRDAQVAMTHAPHAEAAALRAHPSWRYRKLMFNDFILVGPLEDPAGVKGTASIESAMRAIAKSPARFISRGDESGTHEREEQLWELADSRPRPGRLVAAGAGMGTTLRIAAETAAYTLTDRATWAQSGGAPLAILFEGGPHLLNTYAVITDPSGPQADLSASFIDWLTEGKGKTVIEEYRIGDVPVFFLWPAGAPREDPRAIPR